MDEQQAAAAEKFNQLSQPVQEMLRHLNQQEVETLEYVSTIPKDELRGMMKMYRDSKAVIWFIRWSILALIAIFGGAVLVGENVLKVIAWFKTGGNPP